MMPQVRIVRKNKQDITYYDFEQGSEEWLAGREGFYTGSNADKLLLNSKSKRITAGVVSQYAAAENTGFTGNFYTKRGHILEDQAIELHEQITGEKVQHTGFVKNSLYPGCLYSPDGFTDLRLKEVKCFNEKKHLEMFNGNIPLKILAQIHYGMTLLDLKVADLIIYNPKFAKKQFEDENGFMVENPLYDPSKAYKAIPIKRDRDIHNNFKRILGGV